MTASDAPKINIEPCGDIELLTKLFMELALDERSDVERTEKQAQEEMRALIGRGEKAYVFMSGKTAEGYALVNPERTPPYLHHFYICRKERRKGLGTAAYKALLETIGAKEIDLDVYLWNERGRAFWESLGFEPRALIMRYKS